MYDSTSYEYDDTAYYWARFYGPNTGRFISEDPYSLAVAVSIFMPTFATRRVVSHTVFDPAPKTHSTLKRE